MEVAVIPKTKLKKKMTAAWPNLTIAARINPLNDPEIFALNSATTKTLALIKFIEGSKNDTFQMKTLDYLLPLLNRYCAICKISLSY